MDKITLEADIKIQYTIERDWFVTDKEFDDFVERIKREPKFRRHTLLHGEDWNEIVNKVGEVRIAS